MGNHSACTVERAATRNCNCSAAPQMRERGLRSVLFAHEQADDKADVVLLNSYKNGIRRQSHGEAGFW